MSHTQQNEGSCTHVDEVRWTAAQKWEQAFWINTEKRRARFGKNLVWRLLSACGLKSRYRGDDSNIWWSEKFDHYSFLPCRFENAVELGCGPYTNIRHMLKVCEIEHLVLSDPLIKTYVKFPLTFIANMYRSAFCILDDHPAEDCPFASDYFDLTVMTNVLDHVQDADAALREAVRITRPGGILVIGQELSNAADAETMRSDPGQIGHPIRVDHHWLDIRLAGFEPVKKVILSREEGRGPAHHYGTYVFAGIKRKAKE
jgi:SAM-dependent methyltransferase